MNQGYVAPENMGDDQKEFGKSKGGYKKLPSADGEKQFKHPGSGDKSVFDRDHSGVKSNDKRWNEHPHN